MLILDFILYCLTITAAVALRNWSFGADFILLNILTMLPLFPFITAVLYVFSFYGGAKRADLSYKTLLQALCINILLCAMLLYFFSGLLTPKTVLIAVLVVYHILIFYARVVYSGLTARTKNIIILGKSPTLDAIKKELKKSKTYRVRAEYDYPSRDIEFRTSGLDFLLVSANLLGDTRAWEIISEKFIFKAVVLKTDLNFYEDLFRRAPEEGFKNVMWLLRGIGHRNEDKIYDVLKRTVDFTAAFLLAAAFLPIGAIIWLLIKYIDKMPPLFTQERIGLLERNLRIYKFRTMRPGTENITKLGAVLRRFRLDEIPQLINILKGDISIVGPRPVWTKEYHFLNKRILNHSIRSVVKPGLTGWAQLNFKAPPTYCAVPDLPQDECFDAAYQRLFYDVWYIKNRSLFLDMEIMLKTAKRMFIKDKTFNKQG